VIIQPSAEAKSVALFRFHGGELVGPQPVSMESEIIGLKDSEPEKKDLEKKEPENGASEEHAALLQDPDQPQEPQPEPLSAQALDSRIRGAMESLVTRGSHSAQRFSEEVAILKRWYYRSHKLGEIFFANDRGELPLRRIARGAARVYRGEKEAPVLPPIEEQQPS
jgi:hypothetical protein